MGGDVILQQRSVCIRGEMVEWFEVRLAAGVGEGDLREMDD